jgi:hypothetical protein
MKAIIFEISHEFLNFLLNLLAFVPMDGYLLVFLKNHSLLEFIKTQPNLPKLRKECKVNPGQQTW